MGGEEVRKPATFDYVHVGQTILVENLSDNVVLTKGLYLMEVVAEDEDSIAVKGFGGSWWFYRDTGQSYTGDARLKSPVSYSPSDGTLVKPHTAVDLGSPSGDFTCVMHYRFVNGNLELLDSKILKGIHQL